MTTPLRNRGLEALQALLGENAAEAEAQVGLLTLSELTVLSDAARHLDALARKHLDRTCTVCDGPVVWDPSEPTRQQPRWRHVGQSESYRSGAHRAMPDR